ncbi:MAG: MATE family efflux transporter [Alphaproteobacteria bacterium HGW-Alphaproteobacteria-6]|nr:MAG: MATE family efflux transporter [Alphaproteobacteria bacterium HGW-Alphaproteobacteria-6]
MAETTTYGAQARAVLVLGLPLIGSHLAQMILHVTDTVMLGWYGVEALASVVLGASAFFMVFILGSGFGIGVMGMIAAALGRGDDTRVRRDTRMALWLSAGFGALSLPVMWWSDPILRALGQKPELAALAQDYLRIAGFGMIPALLVMVLKSYLSALERAQVVLWVTLAGAAANVALNWALIFGNWGAPELGVRGAAIATTVTQVLGVMLLALYAAWRPELRHFRLFQRFWRPDWEAFGQVFRLGWPIGLTGLAESGLFIAASMMMGWIGTVELAAHGIAMEVAAVTFMVHLGLSNAVTIRAGHAHGRGDAAHLRIVALTGIGLSLGFALLAITVMLTLPGPIIGLFLDERQTDVAPILAFGTALLAVAALFQLFDAAQVMALGLLRAVQDTRAPMWIAAVSYWLIGIPASYGLAFGLGMGGIGLWLGLVVGLMVAALSLMLRFWRGRAG